MDKALKREAASIFLLVVSLVVSFYFYMHFPAKVPMHWNYLGQVDGWGSAAFAAFFLPLLNVGLYLLLTFIPAIDPKKENIAAFGDAYGLLKTAIVFVMSMLYFIVGLAGMGINIAVTAWVTVLIGLLFILIGYVLKKAKQNWTVGLRTPWTLSSEAVWDKTHKLAGDLFVVGGLLMMLEGVVPGWLRIPLFIIILIIVAVVPIVYSYFLFKKEKEKMPVQPPPQP